MAVISFPKLELQLPKLMRRSSLSVCAVLVLACTAMSPIAAQAAPPGAPPGVGVPAIEMEPVEADVAEPELTEVASPEPEPTEAEPTETQATETEPSETEPTQDEPTATERPETEDTETEPTELDPPQVELVEEEPVTTDVTVPEPELELPEPLQLPVRELAKPLAELTVIAHRGAPAFVPEHTAEGVAFAHARGVDYIEQDVVLTRDSVPVVLHDIQLDYISNVAQVFPGRTRPDGHFYVMDFSLAELQQLKLNERVRYVPPAPKPQPDSATAPAADASSATEQPASPAAETTGAPAAKITGEVAAVDTKVPSQVAAPKIRQHAYHGYTAEARYPSRFPIHTGQFKITTLAQQLQLIQGLNQARDMNVGVYIEVKASRWHKQQGYDVVAQIMNVLARHGYDRDELATPIYLQSFDSEDLRRWHRDYKLEAELIQLIGENSWNETPHDYNSMRTSAGLEGISNLAHGVGVWLPHVLAGVSETGEPQFTDLVKHAKQAGLKVHVYTLRPDDLPAGVPDYETLLQWLAQAGVDGYFTDAP